ncbi:MAG: heavy-metal-associated domain-containing protein [Chloroflexi bacterium]|nr:heavy-metal-associated domain-containing protein [Chloroflexota bacterium]
MATTILNVPDISCEHCERTITNALQPLPGVRMVNVDIPGKQVQVEYDDSQVNVDRMKDVLQEEEYPVQSAAPS